MNNTSLIMIIVTSALVHNVVLNQFLGICSFLGVSKQMKASISLGGAVIFVITIASAAGCETKPAEQTEKKEPGAAKETAKETVKETAKGGKQK